jgi:hypothetical protein
MRRSYLRWQRRFPNKPDRRALRVLFLCRTRASAQRKCTSIQVQKAKPPGKTHPDGLSRALTLEKPRKSAIFLLFVLYFRPALAYDRDD